MGMTEGKKEKENSLFEGGSGGGRRQRVTACLSG